MSRRNFSKYTDDIIYVNLYEINETGKPMEMRTSITSTEDIVIDSSEYYLSCVDFNVPKYYIPLFPYRGDLDTVNIRTENTDHRVTIPYINWGNPRDVNGGVIGFQGVYFIQQYLDMVNSALNTAHNQALISNPTIGLNPPFFSYDSSIPNIILNIPDIAAYNSINSFSDAQNQFKAVIIFSNSTYLKFTTLPSIHNGFGPFPYLDERIIISKTPVTDLNIVNIDSVNYVSNPEEEFSGNAWNTIQRILLNSENIPIATEFIQEEITNNITSKSQIIESFNIDALRLDSNKYSLNYQYPYQKQILYSDLNNDTPLRRLSLNFTAISDNGTFTKLFIPPFSTFYVKLMFVKKTIVNSDMNRLICRPQTSNDIIYRNGRRIH